MEVIRAARTSSQADEWALVLTSAGIANYVELDRGAWAVLVPADDAARAHAALAAYDEESRRPWPLRASSAPADLPWTVGAVVGLALLGFFAWTGPPAVGGRWFERGAASAGLMRSEPWRAVTALTLHVDVTHVLGNAVATAVLLPALAQRLGSGCALLLMVVAGATANLIGAIVHEPTHRAVGASTATFAAIGMLAALRFFPEPGTPPPTRKRWVVVAAGVVLLAMLGAGEHSDVLGHALGLVTGGALGAVVGAIVRRPPGLVVQWTLGAVAVLLLLGAWRLAHGGT